MGQAKIGATKLDASCEFLYSHIRKNLNRFHIHTERALKTHWLFFLIVFSATSFKIHIDLLKLFKS